MVIIGSDHTGIELKNMIIKYLYNNNIEYYDATNYKSQESDDYPDTSYEICSKVLKDKKNIGISICGTGIGTSIACNKIKGIRAALCTDKYMSKMARNHNNANVLCLGSRLNILENNIDIVESFLKNSYEGGRHDDRIKKIEKLENLKIEGE